MAKNLYTIKDIKSASYLPPFNAENHVDATRQVQRNAKNPDTLLGEYPEDFEVYYLGSYDNQSAKITMAENGPEFLTSVKALIELQKGQ